MPIKFIVKLAPGVIELKEVHKTCIDGYLDIININNLAWKIFISLVKSANLHSAIGGNQ